MAQDVCCHLRARAVSPTVACTAPATETLPYPDWVRCVNGHAHYVFQIDGQAYQNGSGIVWDYFTTVFVLYLRAASQAGPAETLDLGAYAAAIRDWNVQHGYTLVQCPACGCIALVRQVQPGDRQL